MLRDMCGRRNDNVIAERVATKNAAGNPTAFSVHKGKKETQGLAGRWNRLGICQTYLLDCLIIQMVLERRAMCSSIAAETRKLSSASASFLISAANARIAS